MFFSNSIRWRLQIWHGLILLMVLGGFGLTAWRLEQERVLTSIAEHLAERHKNAMRLMRQSGPPERPDRPRGGGRSRRRAPAPGQSATPRSGGTARLRRPG